MICAQEMMTNVNVNPAAPHSDKIKGEKQGKLEKRLGYAHSNLMCEHSQDHERS